MSKDLRVLSFPTETGIEDFEIYSNIASEGISLDLSITSPGWKRILSTTRSNGGHLDIGLACNSLGKPKIYQNLGLQYSGFVVYPHEAWENKDSYSPEEFGSYLSSSSQPAIYQTYNNVFGENTSNLLPNKYLKITAARIGYAKPGASINDENEGFDENGNIKRNNSIKSYLDIYIDFDEETFSKVELKVNYAGKIYNHGFIKPTSDTINATDTGIYGESLTYSYIDLNSNYIINNQFQNNFNAINSNSISTNELFLKNISIPDAILNNSSIFGNNKSNYIRKISKIDFNNPITESGALAFIPYEYSYNFLYDIIKENKDFTVTTPTGHEVTFSTYHEDNKFKYKIKIQNINNENVNKEVNYTIFSKNMPNIYVPPAPAGYVYVVKDCQINCLFNDGKEQWCRNEYYGSKLNEFKQGNFFIIGYRMYVNLSNKEVGKEIIQYPRVILVKEDENETPWSENQKYVQPIYLRLQNMELKTIDLLNSKYFKSNGEEIYTLDKILIPSNIKIYTSTNEGYELIDDNNLTFEYLYDVKIDFIDILTHIANLESLPRIWSGVSTDDKLGKPGDIWVLAANTTS